MLAQLKSFTSRWFHAFLEHVGISHPDPSPYWKLFPSWGTIFIIHQSWIRGWIEPQLITASDLDDFANTNIPVGVTQVARVRRAELKQPEFLVLKVEDNAGKTVFFKVERVNVKIYNDKDRVPPPSPPPGRPTLESTNSGATSQELAYPRSVLMDHIKHFGIDKGDTENFEVVEFVDLPFVNFINIGLLFLTISKMPAISARFKPENDSIWFSDITIRALSEDFGVPIKRGPGPSIALSKCPICISSLDDLRLPAGGHDEGLSTAPTPLASDDDVERLLTKYYLVKKKWRLSVKEERGEFRKRENQKRRV